MAFIFDQSFNFFIIFWYIPVALLLLLIISLFFTKDRKKILTPKYLKLLIAPVLIPIIIALIGRVFFDSSSVFAQFIVFALIILFLVYEVFIVVKLKRYRFFYFSLLSLFFFYSLTVFFVSSMAIVNDWM